MREQYDAQRGSAGDRGYDHEWRKVRNAYLASHPFCEEQGCIERADEVDHIVELRDGGSKTAFENLRSYCRRHHRIKTARTKKSRGETGC